MPPLPKRKRTRNRIGNRRIHQRLAAPRLRLCPHCRTPKLPHRACPSCGQYRGRAVIVTSGPEEQPSG